MEPQREWKCLTCGVMQWKGKKGAHNASTCIKRHKRKFNDDELDEHLMMVETMFVVSDDSPEMKAVAKTQREVIEDLINERDELRRSIKSLKGRVTNAKTYRSSQFLELRNELEESNSQLEKSNSRLETLEFDNAVLKKKLYVRSSAPPFVGGTPQSEHERDILKKKIAHLEQCHSEAFARTVKLRNEKTHLQQMVADESALRAKFAKEKEEMEALHKAEKDKMHYEYVQSRRSLDAKLATAETEIARQNEIIRQLALIDVEASDRKQKLLQSETSAC